MKRKKLFKAAVRIANGLLSNTEYFNKTVELSKTPEEVNSIVAKTSMAIAREIEKESKEDD